MTDNQNKPSEERANQEPVEELRKKLTSIVHEELGHPDDYQPLINALEAYCQRREVAARRNAPAGKYTQEWVARQLGISRPTLAKWLENPELFTVGALKRLQDLAHLKPKPTEGGSDGKTD